MDIALSSLALVLLSPIFAAVAVAVWLDSGRPVWFSQERVGQGFRRFRIRKFRTMRVQAGGPLVTAAGDDRITRAGKFLRLTKLDELPQLWNVLRGDMSMVGPRPEAPAYVELFTDRYREVLTVRPGITDLASIWFRNEEEILARSGEPLREYVVRVLPAKLDLAEAYVRTHTPIGDLAILFRTAAAIAGCRGSAPIPLPSSRTSNRTDYPL